MSTLGEIYKDYEQHLILEGLRPKTRRYYLWALRNLELWLGGEPAASEVTEVNVRRYFADYMQDHRPRSVRTLKAAIHRLSIYLISEGWLMTDPTQGLRMPRMDEPQQPMPEREQVAAMLTAHKRMPDEYRGAIGHAVISILAFTGMRISDVLNLRVEDVNLQKQTLFVRDSKGGKSYTVPAAPECFEAIRAYLKRRPKDCQHDYLFARSKNTNARYHLVTAILQEMATIVGYRGDKALLPHALRRAYITYSLRDGMDLKAVSTNVGHQHSQVTMDVYNQVDKSQCRVTADNAALMYGMSSPQQGKSKQGRKDKRAPQAAASTSRFRVQRFDAPPPSQSRRNLRRSA